MSTHKLKPSRLGSAFGSTHTTTTTTTSTSSISSSSIIRHCCIIILLCTKLAEAQRPTPCPEVFEYEKIDHEAGEWTAKVNLNTDIELNGVWLNIQLDQPANVLINTFGQSVTTDNRVFVIKNPLRTLGPQDATLEVKFQIKYNAASTVPSVSRLRLNGKTICQEGAVDSGGENPTKLYVSKRVGVTETTPANQQPVNIDVRTNRPTLNTATTPRASTSTGEYYPGDHGLKVSLTKLAIQANNPSQCGVVRMKPNALITRGRNTSDGEWPWHLAIYRSEGVKLSYICGGSIISKTFIITAAHCVARPSSKEPSNVNGLLFYLGTNNLREFGSGIQVHQAKKAFIHPDFNPEYFFNDMALVQVLRNIDFTDYVRPVCLWQDSVAIESIHNELGTVVGWGYDQNNDITENLMQVKMPVVPLSTCIYSHRTFFSTFTFEKNYCAGFMNGSSVCNGDSGGGMVFPTKNDPNIWQLRGLVSIGLTLQGNKCDPKHFVIFTDVAKYVPWIKQTMTDNS